MISFFGNLACQISQHLKPHGWKRGSRTQRFAGRRSLREELLAGRYQPQPVRRATIPKAGGGERELGIPTALDRFIQQATLWLQCMRAQSLADAILRSTGCRRVKASQRTLRRDAPAPARKAEEAICIPRCA